MDILKNSRQPMLTVCLSDTVRQVRAEQSATLKKELKQPRSVCRRAAAVTQKSFVAGKFGSKKLGSRGGEMVGELNVLNEWIPEQMHPGTIFVLENAGRVGEKEDPYWAVLACPDCGTLGLITRKQLAGLLPGHLRLRPVLSAVLHQRQRHRDPQAQLGSPAECRHSAVETCCNILRRHTLQAASLPTLGSRLPPYRGNTTCEYGLRSTTALGTYC